MKILLVYPNLGGPVGFHIGLAHLSGALKARSHEVRLLHLNATVGFPFDLERVVREAREYGPDLVGITACTEEFATARAVARELKDKLRHDLPVVVGGVHVTLNAEEVVGNEEFDLVCVGEGEGAIVDIAEAIEQGRDPSTIDNVWARRDGKVVSNRLRPLARLDELPPLDLELFDVARLTQIRNGWVDVMFTAAACTAAPTASTRRSATVRAQRRGRAGQGVPPLDAPREVRADAARPHRPQPGIRASPSWTTTSRAPRASSRC
jgi:radical SAM superfamily enzyme YgiQ (UPF0313 family)